jgi:hypothetical protein
MDAIAVNPLTVLRHRPIDQRKPAEEEYWSHMIAELEK